MDAHGADPTTALDDPTAAGWAPHAPSLIGRTAVVTGANGGLGREVSLALAALGARVVLAVRRPEAAASLRSAVAARAEKGGALDEPSVVPLDLSDLGSVAAAAEAVGALTGRVDILLNNAGVMALPPDATADGFELQIGVNHLGHFALTGRLLPLVLAAPRPRVVTTTSVVHRLGRMHWHGWRDPLSYGKWPAYTQSKLANLLFARELDRRARSVDSPLISVAAHPGYASTHIQTRSTTASGSRMLGGIFAWGNGALAQTAAAGAGPLLYAAVMPDVRGGEVFGPAGFGQMRGRPTRVEGSDRSARVDQAARLWERSEQATGVPYSDLATRSSRGRRAT